MFDWVQQYEVILWWLLPISILSFFATLIAVPMLLVRLPYDYFSHEKRHSLIRSEQHILIQLAMIVLKNTLGAVLLLMGFIMLFTPGQGVITMLVGLMLLNYPGKYQLERWIVSRPTVFHGINWLRRHAHRHPLVL